jgi:hypothetical protein
MISSLEDERSVFSRGLSCCNGSKREKVQSREAVPSVSEPKVFEKVVDVALLCKRLCLLCVLSGGNVDLEVFE